MVRLHSATPFVFALAVAGCAPDEFAYASAGPGPACVGDGCPLTCPDEQVLQGEHCITPCGPWVHRETITEGTGLAITGERAFIVGNEAAEAGRPKRGRVRALELCDGAELEAVLSGDPGGATADAIALGVEGPVVVGAVLDDVGGGAYLTEFSGEALSTASAKTELQGMPGDLLSTAVGTPSGVWALGVDALGSAWGVKWSADGVCKVALGSSMAEPRALAGSGNDVVALFEREQGIGIARFDDAACVAPGCSQCAPAAISPVLTVPDTARTEPRGLALDGQGAAYVVGVAHVPGAEARGFVAEVKLSSLTLGTWLAFDDGDGHDVLGAAAVQSGALLVGGGVGLSTPDAWGTGRGSIVSYALPLDGSSAPAWQVLLPWNVASVSGLAAAADGSAFFALTAASGGDVTLHRCVDGNCPL